jgi:hypothetical protein
MEQNFSTSASAVEVQVKRASDGSISKKLTSLLSKILRKSLTKPL